MKLVISSLESITANLLSVSLISLKIKSFKIVVFPTPGEEQRSTEILKLFSCNKLKRDYDISIHFNACYHSESDGKTKGVECWIYDKSNPTKRLGDLICKNISNIGFKNRGVKESKSLYFIKNTDKPAIIIEVCFVDDFDDVKLYKKNKDKVAEAIANAIIECCKQLTLVRLFLL